MVNLRILYLGLFLVNILCWSEETPQATTEVNGEFSLKSLNVDSFAAIPSGIKEKITNALEAGTILHEVKEKYSGDLSEKGNKEKSEAEYNEKKEKEALSEALSTYETVRGLLDLEKLLEKSLEISQQKRDELKKHIDRPNFRKEGSELVRSVENEQRLILEMLKKIQDIKRSLRGEAPADEEPVRDRPVERESPPDHSDPSDGDKHS